MLSLELNDSFRQQSVWPASEYVLVDSNSGELLYLGSATLTRTAATAPSRRALATFEHASLHPDKQV
jgi:hypothetical protein